jgi:putative endopeptidase
MKNIKISFLAVTVLLASCSNKEELVSGITKKNMDTLVKPGDNFDRFVK